MFEWRNVLNLDYDTDILGALGWKQKCVSSSSYPPFPIICKWNEDDDNDYVPRKWEDFFKRQKFLDPSSDLSVCGIKREFFVFFFNGSTQLPPTITSCGRRPWSWDRLCRIAWRILTLRHISQEKKYMDTEKIRKKGARITLNKNLGPDKKD